MNETTIIGELFLQDVLTALVAQGIITQEEAGYVKAQAKRLGQNLHPLEIVANCHLAGCGMTAAVTLSGLTDWLAKWAQLDRVHIDALHVDALKTTAVMSLAFAHRNGLLCLDVSEDQVVIATLQPFETDWLVSLEQVLEKTVRRVVANPAEVRKFTEAFYGLKKAIVGARVAVGTGSGNSYIEPVLAIDGSRAVNTDDLHIVHLVERLLQFAFEQRASDIHLEPRLPEGRVRLRIDGILHTAYRLPAAVMTSMISRLKILARMDVTETRRPQVGRIKTSSPHIGHTELRLSSMPAIVGEKLVVRIFDASMALKDFSEIGLYDRDLRCWRDILSMGQGLALVTGPTGSGKTTTLYASLKYLACEGVNLSTIEDPVEMVVEDFNQSQINPAIGFTFAEAIRALLRQDPDVIMVGEIRDKETAQMAVQAALTGHLVVSTLHTQDAPTAISRLRDLNVPMALLRATLVGIMAQRLTRVLCTQCRIAVTASNIKQRAVAETLVEMDVKGSTLFSAGGCSVCRNTGYVGRTGIFEIMPLSKPLERLLSDPLDLSALRERAVVEGMTQLRKAGANMVAKGVTSVAEIQRVTASSDAT